MFSHGREADRPIVGVGGVAGDLALHRHGFGRTRRRRLARRRNHTDRAALVHPRFSASADAHADEQRA